MYSQPRCGPRELAEPGFAYAFPLSVFHKTDFFFCLFFGATPAAYGSSQARG